MSQACSWSGRRTGLSHTAPAGWRCCNGRVTRETAPLDEISKRIIEQLQEDGRRPYATIGKAVGLSETAVRQRVQRLSEAGVIQIVAVTDPLRVGIFRQAMVAVNVAGPIEPVADALAEMPEVPYVVICGGRFDILAEVVCVDDASLLELISSRIRTLPGVRNAEALVYLRLRKDSYRWAIP
ncbi:MAG: Lrp/AsnC family transcriptional regulator, regulator for asnA, asnC and gidA [Pseudonocardiales bacterium]|jgi:Lrp/AsnC family transcriptional regulator for asnA, asnC and gidA|nr:Lrp/AsnC family transcriptional regulator, regulator for asnA, asnC and gidA [Pseudonocardiales bacterium]